MFGRTMNFQSKLMLTFIVAGTAPLVVSAFVSVLQSTKEIEAQAEARSIILAKGKIAAIQNYFESSSAALVDLSQNPFVKEALEDLAKPFAAELPMSQSPLIQNYRDEVRQFYTKEFAATYLERTKIKLDVQSIVDKLDPLALAAQYDFIAANVHPLGKKDLLTSPKQDSPYGRAHARVHEVFRGYLTRHSLYDLFLIDINGRVVYSVFKETDFATSLRTGPWATSNLAKAFEKTITYKDGEVHIEDFATYGPSYDALASFAGTPIFVKGQLRGILIIQLPLDKISAVASNRDGLGEMGETLLLGEDLRLRTDTFRNKATHNVAAAFASGSTISVESPAVQRARAGETGFMRNTSYDGVATLAFYTPVKLGDLTWYAVTELAEEELFAGQRRLTQIIILIIAAGIVSIMLATFLFSSRSVRQLKSLLSQVSTEAAQLQASSKTVLTSAQQLSSATTQQSAAIEETVASMEEMSSMLAQTAQQATRSLEYSEIGHTEAAKGRGVMAKMSAAMDEIQTSNSKLDRLVALINDIKERTNVINDIVSETRLLSFNASIEAARAGAQGKGFAVVAEEVGKLAAMSGKAASDIKQLLDSSTTEVTLVVQETHARVQVGKRISGDCEVMFNVMKESLEKIDKSVKLIAAATQEQEAGIKQTNTAMTDMSHATQSNSKSVESLTGESTTLASGAQSLQKAVATLQMSMIGGATNPPDLKVTFSSNEQLKTSADLEGTLNQTSTQIASPDSTISRRDSRWRRAS